MNNKKPWKIKEIFCGILAFLVLLNSLAETLGILVVKYEKSVAVWYLLLWLWAFYYVATTTDKDFSKIELENELMKEKIIVYENRIKELEAKTEMQHE